MAALQEKAQVPAIQKAIIIIQAISEQESVKAQDILTLAGGSKSHLYATLNTLCAHGWLHQNTDKSYSIGNVLVKHGTMRLYPLELVRLFHAELSQHKDDLEFTCQMSILEHTEIIYLGRAKRNGDGMIMTYPGMRMPAHSTAMGKVMLSQFNRQQIDSMYPSGHLEQLTHNTVSTVDELWTQLQEFKHHGVLIEVGEASLGYSCVAAAIYNSFGRIAAAISMTTLAPYPSDEHEQAAQSVQQICTKISTGLGYTP